jgi:hypothetical protein
MLELKSKTDTIKKEETYNGETDTFKKEENLNGKTNGMSNSVIYFILF